ncbi:MAG: nuclear transport factor 2 family protein [Geodermatophilaceae bacterium]|nr:nuclear transport factor 2 family protein [Geodermatophilaceae bacterium]
MADSVNVSHPSARRFLDALAQLERSSDVAAMDGVFADDALLRRMTHGGQEQRTESAAEFWTAYRATFGEIVSAFTAVTEGPESVVLEWTSSGTLAAGAPVTYAGVSVLDLPTDDGALTGFRTYYDSAAFDAQSPPLGR